MTRGTLLGAGTQILGMAVGDSSYAQLANTATQLGGAAFMARYGRAAELESDAYGMKYMARAGYDPQGAVTLQQTFVKLSKGKVPGFLEGLFASHPPSQARVDANRELVKTLPSGNTYTERYQRKIAQLKQDKPAYKAEEEAIKALKNKNPQQALTHLDKAVKLQPADGYFWELRGHAWKMQKDFKKADQAFSTAIRKNPELFSHHLARGILRYEQGNKQEAKTDLERSNQLLKTQAASYLLGELAMQSNNTSQALKYYQNAAQGSGQYSQQAQMRIASLEIPKAPHKYIASQPYVKDGRLIILIKNRSAVSVSGVRVEVSEILNAYLPGPSATYRVSGSLKPGQQTAVNTSVKDLPTEDARNYRTRVIAAQVIQ